MNPTFVHIEVADLPKLFLRLYSKVVVFSPERWWRVLVFSAHVDTSISASRVDFVHCKHNSASSSHYRHGRPLIEHFNSHLGIGVRSGAWCVGSLLDLYIPMGATRNDAAAFHDKGWITRPTFKPYPILLPLPYSWLFLCVRFVF